MTELTRLTIAEARGKLSKKEITATELTDAYIAAIDDANGALNAYVAVTPDKARAMAKASDEMSHWAEYDYVVINREVDQAFADVKAILAAERLKRERQPGLSDFVRGLQAKL